MTEILVKLAIVLAALVWAFWPVAYPPVPTERAERCQQAKDREKLRPSAFASDEVYYYCVRAR